MHVTSDDYSQQLRAPQISPRITKHTKYGSSSRTNDVIRFPSNPFLAWSKLNISVTSSGDRREIYDCKTSAPSSGFRVAEEQLNSSFYYPATHTSIYSSKSPGINSFKKPRCICLLVFGRPTGMLRRAPERVNHSIGLRGIKNERYLRSVDCQSRTRLDNKPNSTDEDGEGEELHGIEEVNTSQS